VVNPQGSDSTRRNSLTFDLLAICSSPINFQNKRLTSLVKKDFQCGLYPSFYPSKIIKGSFLERFFFIFLVEPVLVETLRDVSVQLERGDELARFQCRCVGYPTPRIEWFKNSQRIVASEKFSISSDETNLIVNFLNDNDAGVYECIARNSVGQARSVANLRITKPFGKDQFSSPNLYFF
jgi:hypothetical protein